MLRSRPLELRRIEPLVRLLSLGMILMGSWLCVGALRDAALTPIGRWHQPASTQVFLSASWAIMGVMLARCSGRLAHDWAKEVVMWMMVAIILGAIARAGFGVCSGAPLSSWPWWELLAISIELTLPTCVIVGLIRAKRYG